MAFGFDIEAAGKGAQALQTMMTAQPEAQAGIAKAQYEKARYEGLQKYMKAAATPSTPSVAPPSIAGIIAGTSDDPAIIAGNGAYNAIQMSKQLQQERQSLKNEEDRLKLLSPEDKRIMEAGLERRQSAIDRIEQKLLNDSERYLGQNFSVLDSIDLKDVKKGPEQYKVARDYFTRQYSQMADQAGLTGPVKDKFIQDHIEQSIGSEYNPQIIEAKKMGMVSISDNIKMKQLDKQIKADQLRYEAMMAGVEARKYSADRVAGARGTETHTKLVESARKANSDALAKMGESIKSLTKQIADLQDPIKTEIPKKTTGGVLGFGSQDNPMYTQYSTLLDGKKKMLEAAQAQYTKLQQEQEQLKEQTEREAYGKAFKSDENVGSSQDNPASPTSTEEFDSLPSGSWFINPADNKVYQKK